MNKYQEKQLAKIFSPLASSLQIPKLFRPFYQGQGHILMYHRIQPESNITRIHNHLSLEVTQDQLREAIKYFQKRNYDFLSLDQLPERLSKKDYKKRFVVFTFDDGYVDNLTHALPVFKEFNVPFTVYITTDFPDGKAVLWWYLLEELLLQKDEVSFEHNNETINYQCKSLKEKEFIFYKLRAIFNKINLDEIIKFFEKYNINIYSKTKELALSWNQVIELSKEELVSIGAHTVTHPALNKLSLEEAKDEILNSKSLLENKTGIPIEHFSYPFGSKHEVGDREFQLVKELGFKTSTTTRLANIFSEHSEHLEALPRLTINSIMNKYVLDLLSSGMFPALRNKLKKIIVE
jgi:peptidoglycan/xylan/chitin deacetylase (PgdA/CDA1 family)